MLLLGGVSYLNSYLHWRSSALTDGFPWSCQCFVPMLRAQSNYSHLWHRGWSCCHWPKGEMRIGMREGGGGG